MEQVDSDAPAPGGEAVEAQQPAGNAPWEREGVAGPDDPEARARADRWRAAAAEMDNAPVSREELRRRRAEERRARREEAEAEAERTHEANARRMYIAGFFALPLLWLVSLFYFHKEHKSPDANPAIKKCSYNCVRLPTIPALLNTLQC